MVVKNPLRVAHGCFRRGHHDRLVCPPGQQPERDDQQYEKDWRFHSAFNTVSNRRKQAVVKITQYPAKNFIWLTAENSPVSTSVVAVTKATTAGKGKWTPQKRKQKPP